MSLHSILAETTHALLDSDFRITATDVVERARKNNEAIFAAETDKLVMDAARRIVKEILRDLTQDDHAASDDQVILPGLVLPSAIAVEDEGGNFYYVKAQKATRQELQAGRAQRVSNVLRAQKRLDQYDETLELLLPLMDDDDMTVEDAVRLLSEGQPS